MASLRNAVQRRTYLERSQPAGRQKKFGLLEKHGDYVKRARDYEKKKTVLAELREKARLRNPDEFNFKMIKRRVQDGSMIDLQTELSEEQKCLLESQDTRYLNMRKSADQKRIETLENELHFLDAPRQNRHVLFVDSTSEESSTESDDDEGSEIEEGERREERQGTDNKEGGEEDGEAEAVDNKSRKRESRLKLTKIAESAGSTTPTKTGKVKNSKREREVDNNLMEVDVEDGAVEYTAAVGEVVRGNTKRRGAKIELKSKAEDASSRMERKRMKLQSLNVADMFDTPEELFELMAHNRPTNAMLRKNPLDDRTVASQAGSAKSAAKYRQLLLRKNREAKLDKVLQRMELRHQLLHSKRAKVVKQGADGKVIVRWMSKRQK